MTPSECFAAFRAEAEHGYRSTSAGSPEHSSWNLSRARTDTVHPGVLSMHTSSRIAQNQVRRVGLGRTSS
jgi:hypothetical protein